jgi:lipopolysaccharide transport system ATP-binding protein
MKPVVRVENLGKQYKIGRRQAAYGSLRDVLGERMRWPLRSGKRNGNQAGETIWALQDVNFTVDAGEIVGIIGRNGAGKSTLLKVLARVTEPTTGRVKLYARLGSLLEVGTGFHPDLTGRENIFLNGAILGMKRLEIKRKFDDIVAFSEIEKFIDTPVKFYSSGMYMRLAFAVAAHLEPEILLVDEVLAVGDADFQKKCLGKMGEIRNHGRTVLIVSHNMASISNLCQRTLLLSDGKVIAEGKPEDVVPSYLASARLTGGEAVWSDVAQAPGNDSVRLLAVRIFQEGIDGATGDVDISKEILVQITYQNFVEATPLYAGLWLKDQLGTFVLSSANLHSMNLTTDPWYGEPHPCGVFQSVCRLPGNFLNEGRYHITAIVGKVPANTQILEENAVYFDVHDTGEMRKEYFGKWVGSVRPRLPWQTQHLS